MEDQNKTSIKTIATFVIILIIVGGIGYTAFSQKSDTANSDKTGNVQTQTQVQTQNQTPKTYRNETYKIEFQYPAILEEKEVKASGSAVLLVRGFVETGKTNSPNDINLSINKDVEVTSLEKAKTKVVEICKALKCTIKKIKDFESSSGAKGIVVTFSGKDVTISSILFVKNNLTYTFNLNIPGNESLLLEVAKTLKFL